MVRTNKEGVADLTDAKSLLKGDLYHDDAGSCILPLGLYTIKETKAPEGYLLPDIQAIQAEVVQEGDKATLRLPDDPARETADVTFLDQVERQDLRFQKIAADSQSPLANVPFLITAHARPDGGTPESHVIVTDADGRFDSASFAPGTRDNANDDAVSGLTFTTDDRGTVAADLSQLSLDEGRLDGTRGLWFAGGTSAPTAMACRRRLLAGPSRLVGKPGSARVAPLLGWHLRQDVNPHEPPKNLMNDTTRHGFAKGRLSDTSS